MSYHQLDFLSDDIHYYMRESYWKREDENTGQIIKGFCNIRNVNEMGFERLIEYVTLWYRACSQRRFRRFI